MPEPKLGLKECFYFRSAGVRFLLCGLYVARQAPLSMGFSRQEYWSGLPSPSPGHLAHPGTEPGSPALQVGSLRPEPPLGGKQRPQLCRGACRPLEASPLLSSSQRRWFTGSKSIKEKHPEALHRAQTSFQFTDKHWSNRCPSPKRTCVPLEVARAVLFNYQELLLLLFVYLLFSFKDFSRWTIFEGVGGSRKSLYRLSQTNNQNNTAAALPTPG